MPEWNEELLKNMAAAGLDSDFPLELALPVKMLVMDADGVLTDGGLYYDNNGLALKRFDVQDGLGIRLAQKAGIECAIISGMRSRALEQRAMDLEVAECHAGQFQKLTCLREIMRRKNLHWANVAYIGDDLIDLPVMFRAGLAVAVQNAQPEVKLTAHYVSPLAGGRGAVRHLLRQILMAQGRQEEVVSWFARLEEHDGPPLHDALKS